MAYITKWILFHYKNFLVNNLLKYLEGNAINYMWITSSGNYWQNIVILSKRARTQDTVTHLPLLYNLLYHKNVIFRDETTCNLIDEYQSGSFTSYPQMEELCSSEILVRIYQITWHHFPEAVILMFTALTASNLTVFHTLRAMAELWPCPHNCRYAKLLHLTEKSFKILYSSESEIQRPDWWQKNIFFCNLPCIHLQKCR
jgi:hypothetical protein